MQWQEALGRGVGCLLDPSPFLATDGAMPRHSTLPWHSSVQAQEGSELPPPHRFTGQGFITTRNTTLPHPFHVPPAA